MILAQDTLADGTIRVVVQVDRKRTPLQALTAIKPPDEPLAIIVETTVGYENASLLEVMPRGEGKETELYFSKVRLPLFRLWISDEQIDRMLALQGRKAADAYSVAALDEANPAFVTKHPHFTHWRNAAGKWCYAAFTPHRRGCTIGVFLKRFLGWGRGWWIASVPIAH